ncbi:unnamed protein product [Haemonchus placei]|uniref:Uncharacterized protein n=1 Tax=Haemonchus placei TaxID=6290 RepID=A0A0N4W561_HAEPC|nr:unnamed protein product [Haemonchus placei]
MLLQFCFILLQFVKPTFNKEETARLVRATMVGEGLKINMGRSASTMSSTTQLPRPSGAQQR